MYFIDSTDREYGDLTNVVYSSYGLWNDLTDRTNRTVRENDPPIVKKVFQSNQFVTKCSFEGTDRTN